MDIDNAINYINQAYELMIEENMFNAEVFLDHAFSKNYYKNKNTDSILKSFFEIKKKIDSNDVENLFFSNQYISGTYMKKGEYKKALRYYKKNLKYSKDIKKKHRISLIYLGITQCYFLLNKIDSAYYFNEKVLGDTKNYINSNVYIAYYENKKHFAFINNDVKNYRIAEIKFDSIKEKYYGVKTRTEIAKNEFKNALKLKNIEIELLEKNNQIKRIQLISFFSVVSFLLLVTILIITKRNKYKRIINEQKMKLINDEKKLRSQELISKTAIISKKTNLLNMIIQELSELKKKTNFENYKKIDEIIKEINIDSNQFWDEFYIYFNDIYDNFFELIKKKYPSITATELRIIAFIKLNYSSKEISKITYTSERTVQKHRQNIRKKMEIESKTDLTSFIQDLNLADSLIN